MEIIGINKDATLEAIKMKHGEQDFYDNIAKYLDGIAISKITPFTKTYFDLLYILDNKTMLIKFIDTNQDTFDIIGEEILEIIIEEELQNKKILNKHFSTMAVSTVYIMPYINVKVENIKIIDKTEYKRIKSKPEFFLEYFDRANEEVENQLLKYYLAPELHALTLVNNEKMKNDYFKRIVFSKEDREVAENFLSKKQVEQVNTINYGTTLIEGPSGSGKTTLMFAHAVKMARLYPKDKFLYVAFDKQLVHRLKDIMLIKNIKLPNLRIISYHQYVMLLGKKYGLRINVEHKSNFDKEFEKILKKVTQIYKDEHIYKGIFVDEGENYRQIDLDFLKTNLYKGKWVFELSVDEAKDIKNKEKISVDQMYEDEWDNKIVLYDNFRQGKEQLEYLEVLRNKMLDNLDFVVSDGSLAKKLATNGAGESSVNVLYSIDTVGMLSDISEEIKKLLEQGYKYSDIAIVYPFNKRTVKKKGQIYSQYIVKNGLAKAGLPYVFAVDNMSSLREKNGITLSNIYNICNLEYKVIILCELDTLFENMPEKIEESSVDSYTMIYNILYTGISRSFEKTYIYLREDCKRSDIPKLLKM